MATMKKRNSSEPGPLLRQEPMVRALTKFIIYLAAAGVVVFLIVGVML